MSVPPWGFLAVALLGVGCAAPAGPSSPLPSAGELPAAADPAPLTLVIFPAGPSSRRPLPTFRHRCRDRRFPALAGPWVVGCGPAGHLDRAEHLESGLLVELDSPADSAGLGDGLVYAPGREHGLWTLPDPIPRHGTPLGATQQIAAPAIQGLAAALALQGRVSVFQIQEAHRLMRDADPLPWFPPALAWPAVYWVDGRDQATSGLDIWGWDHRDGPPFPVVTRPGDQRHVAASERWLAWLDDEGVWLQDHATGERWLHPADTGFRAGPSLWGSVACWEERTAGDIDVRCSDGLEATGEGDQGWPSRWGPRLLIRQADMPWLITAEEYGEEQP